MAHKKKHGHPVPPDNQQRALPSKSPDQAPLEAEKTPPPGAPFEEQDPKHRLGNFTGKGEHSIQQPGGANGANR